MTGRPENPPAFPKTGRTSVNGDNEGMTLRDWFAGQALTEFASLIEVKSSATMHVVARISYDMADAMLAARQT